MNLAEVSWVGWDSASPAAKPLRFESQGTQNHPDSFGLELTIIGVFRENPIYPLGDVLDGEVYLSAQMEKKSMQQFVGRRSLAKGTPLKDLSKREMEVFELIGQGHRTRQIAETLHVSVKTVESHRQHIKEKLRLADGHELVQHAIQWHQA